MRNRFVLLITFIGCGSVAHGASYYISSSNKTELVGSTSALPIGTGGSTANFPSGTVVVGTTFAQFRLLEVGSNVAYADMKVTVVGKTGEFRTTDSKSGLMIAQTSNSQGLLDTGTLSILTSMGSAVGGEIDATFQFSFYEPGTTTPKNVALEVTSFDFDFDQYMEMQNTDFNASAHGAHLVPSDNGIFSRWAETDGLGSEFNDANHALVFNNVQDSSFELTLGKVGNNSNALFMFEFRDPSTNLSNPLTPISAVPEFSHPAIYAPFFCSLLAFRRSRTR
jgi:hypothetical protein